MILGTTELVTDLPDFADWAPKIWWDRHYRAFGPTEDSRVVLCSEEDLLALPGEDPPEDSACLHELAHGVGFARAEHGPKLERRVERAFQDAMRTGLWGGTYSATNGGEYFAVGTQAWFGSPDVRVDGVPLGRDGLKAYDPSLGAICESVWGEGAWRYLGPWSRPAEERAHLEGFDREHAGPFAWPERARWDISEVRLSWSEDPPARSPPSTTATWLILSNRRQQPVEVGWVDLEGVRRPMFALRSGEEVLRDTFAGHIWYVQRGDRLLGEVVADPEVGWIEIGPSPPPEIDPAARATWDLATMRLAWTATPPSASPASDEMTWLLLTNHRAANVVVEWLDFEGERRRLQTLGPGESSSARMSDTWASSRVTRQVPRSR